jgi:hypothetical protein
MVLDENPEIKARISTNSPTCNEAKRYEDRTERNLQTAEMAKQHALDRAAAAREAQLNRQALQTSAPFQGPVGSGIVDRRNGAVYDPHTLTRGDVIKGADNFAMITPQNMDVLGRIENVAKPQLDQLRDIVGKLSVKTGGKNIGNYNVLELKKGLGVDPDVAQYADLKNKLTLEQSLILGGGSRILTSIFNKMEGSAMPNLKQTTDVQTA